MVTHDIDSKYLAILSPAERDIYRQAGTGAVRTNLAHIFPPSTNWNLKPEEDGHAKVSIYSARLSCDIDYLPFY
jgi:hypothetical protein